MRLIPISAEATLGYRYRLSKKRFPSLYKKVVTKPVYNMSTRLWLKVFCKGRLIQTQKDMSKFLKRLPHVISSPNREFFPNPVIGGGVHPEERRSTPKSGHPDKDERVYPEERSRASSTSISSTYSRVREVIPAGEGIPAPIIILWATRFLPTLDEVNIQSLANCMLRLKLNNEPLYIFTCKQVLGKYADMDYTRLLHTLHALSKLHSIYNFDITHLSPTVIGAAERLVKEEITGMHLGLLTQSLYYCKLFSNGFVELLMDMINMYELTPENINSIYGYISLYPGSDGIIKQCVKKFIMYLESSKVDSKNIYKFLKIRQNNNNMTLKRYE